jgi:hypothetical protein
MGEFSRRTFLVRGSVTAAAAGLAVALPGMPAVLSTAETEAPEATGEATAVTEEAGILSQPLVAHVKDLSTGEMALFMGDSEVTFRDPQLANRLFRAAR